MLVTFLKGYLENYQIIMVGILLTWLVTLQALRCKFSFLPHDLGRAYAVNGELSKGKLRGVGLVMVICYLVLSVLFVPLTKEYLFYGGLLFLVMLSGYMDDAAKTPWSEYKKGLIDFVLAAATVAIFVMNNDTTVSFLQYDFVIPKALYAVLGVILLWTSINVTNCSDGVDGLCGSLSVVTIGSFACIYAAELGSYRDYCFLFMAVLFAYLYFNTSPSSMLMGDAGSRTIGFFIALIAMKSGHPFSFLLLAVVLLVDGGIGLIKVSLLRFLKIRILKNTRTPLHDEMRKNRGWSDTQVVFRFLIIQIAVSVFMFFWR